MVRKAEQPTVTPDGDGERWDHPAYCMVRAARVSGSSSLYGSDFRHQHFITLEIERGYMVRNLASDWFHTYGLPLIEVSMSEAQWATLISSLNTQGVPGTLERFNGAPLPSIPDPVDRTAQFGKELTEDMDGAIKSINVLIEKLEQSGLSAKKIADIRQHAHKAIQEISGNAKFVAGRFSEHMEEEKEKARLEINTYLTHRLTLGGLNTAALEAEKSDSSNVIELPE